MELANARVLLIDDDASAVLVMRQMLADCARLRFAHAGEEALRLAHREPPDLILLDARMPGMSGLQVCAALKSDSRLVGIPIMVVTGSVLTDVEVAMLKAGAVDVLTKPLERESFRSRIRSVLRLPGESRPELTPEDNQPRVLVVDDDASAIHLLQTVLAGVGHIHFAVSGQAALVTALRVEPDIILLDAHMPDLDGYEVCARLRTEPAFTRTPIVFVTRYADPEGEARAFDKGATDFIAKPYSTTVLRARIRNLLRLKRQADAETHAIGRRWRDIADHRVAHLVHAASDAILSCDLDGRIILANPAAEALFERPDDLVGAQLAELHPALDCLGQAPKTSFSIEIRRRDGSMCFAEVQQSSTGTSDSALHTWIIRDRTDRQRIEAERRAREAAQATNTALNRMMRFLAHELRNPLNGIMGVGQLLSLELQPGSKAASWLGIMATSAQVIHQRILDLERVSGSGELALQVTPVPIDLRAEASAASLAAAALAMAAEVDLRAPESGAPVPVLADSARLQQCLANLVSNAIKYNRPRGWLALEVAERAGRGVISVQDGGVGMSEQQLAHLFEPFNRLGREHGNIPGTGLGLVITRGLILAMGGDLEVHSCADEGTRIDLSFPLHEPNSR